MPIRMTGLNSGLDTESIIAALMSAQRTKQTKVENKRTKLEWKKEQWASLNTKIYNFYTNSLSKMRMASTYRAKAATSSNNSKVTAKATTAAATGSYSIKVGKVASAQKVTSGKLQGAVARDDKGDIIADKIEKVTSKTKLVDLQGADFGNNTQIKIESKADDKTVYLQVDEDTTVSDFISRLNDAGLSASFDEKQQRFFINSSKSGTANKFTITSGKMTQKQIDATTDLKNAIGYDKLSTDNQNKADNIMAGLQSGTKTVDDVIEELTTLANESSNSEAKKIATELYTAEAKASVLNNFDADVKEALNKDNLTEDDVIKYLKDKGYEIDKSNDKSQQAANIEEAKKKYADKEAGKLIKKEPYKTNIEKAVKGGIDEKEIERVKNTFGSSGVSLKEDDSKYKIDDQMTRAIKINNDLNGLNGNDGYIKKYESAMKESLEADTQNALGALGLGTVTGDSKKETVDKDGKPIETEMVVIAAEDTEINYNGVTLKSDTTDITIAGVELNILAETNSDETINISVTNDTSAVYDTIKEFVSEYNAILKEMNTLYNAGSAKDYDVLSDEEKDAMSDSEVEKWESKIKDSLLRRDSTLGAIVSSFKNNMMGTYTSSEGKKYALSSIGISTSQDYKEGGLLHILGDEDDSEYADKTNLLKKMLDEDPDVVTGVFAKLTDTLYSDLQKKMSATSMSSALTFYNDKEMSSQLSDYKDEISKWQSRLDEMEDKYYKQFSAMETALANIQSQQNSIASMLGGGN